MTAFTQPLRALVRDWRWGLLGAAVLLPLLAFAVGPVAWLVVQSIAASGTQAAALIAAESDAFRNTLLTASGSALLAFSLGTPLAVLLVRTDLPLRRILLPLFILPSAIPSFIWGMGWVSLANPRVGFLNRLFGEGTFDIYGAAGIAFVLGTAELPLVLLAGSAALSRIDPSLEEAARVSGAGPFRALATATLPLAMPALLSGAVMVFLSSASAFGVPYMLGVSASPPTSVLTTRVYGQVLLGGEDNLHRALVLSTVLLVLAPVALVAIQLLGRAGRVRLLSGKGLAERPLRLGAWRWPLLAAVLATAGVLLALPLLAVLVTSLQQTFGAPLEWSSFTLAHWGEVLTHSRTLRAAVLSLSLAVASGLLVCLLGLGIAVLRKRGGAVGRGLESLSLWPFSLPGTVLALALLISFSQDLHFIFAERVSVVLALANTAGLLVIAYVAKHLALGARNLVEALSQQDPSLAESARVHGAGPIRAFSDAVLPLLARPLGVAFVLTFLLCSTEMTMSVLLVPTGQDLLGTLLFDLQSYADPAAAAVLACALVAVVFGIQGLRVLAARGLKWKRGH